MIAMGHMAGRHEICPYGALPPIACGVFADGGDRGINERNVGHRHGPCDPMQSMDQHRNRRGGSMYPPAMRRIDRKAFVVGDGDALGIRRGRICKSAPTQGIHR